jgi:hypothetical protein
MVFPIGVHALASLTGWVSGEPMQPFSWLIYFGFAAIYTAAIFIGYFVASPRVFSPQNIRKRSTVVAVHCAFVAVLLGAIWLACRNLASMPTWLTEKGFMVPTKHHFAMVSLLDILFFLLAVILRMIEMPCIYAESKTPHAGTFENPSAPRWMNPPGD